MRSRIHKIRYIRVYLLQQIVLKNLRQKLEINGYHFLYKKFEILGDIVFICDNCWYSILNLIFASKHPGGPALHIEAVCQGPVTSLTKENVGACDGYKGPNFKSVLPKIGQHVMVTGRYLIEMPEMPGGITELHPVYDIKILPHPH
jgi:hypothetical protein